MDLKTIIKSLRTEIKFEKDSGGELEHISWPYQEGIIISVNDLEKLLDVCEGKLSDTEQANGLSQRVMSSCPICQGRGEYTTGGSFGGPVQVHKCDCGAITP